MNLLLIYSYVKQIEGTAMKHVRQKSVNSVCVWERAGKQKQFLGLVNSPNDDEHKTQNDSVSSISVAESDSHLWVVMQSAWSLLPASYSTAQLFMFFKVKRKVHSHPASAPLEIISVEI